MCRNKLVGKNEEIVIVERDGEKNQLDSNTLDYSDDNIALLDFQLILCKEAEVLM